MQPHPYFFPGYLPAERAYARPPQLPYMPQQWAPQDPADGLMYQPNMSNYMTQPSATDPHHVPADVHTRMLQKAIQASSLLQNLATCLPCPQSHSSSLTHKIRAQNACFCATPGNIPKFALCSSPGCRNASQHVCQDRRPGNIGFKALGQLVCSSRHRLVHIAYTVFCFAACMMLHCAPSLASLTFNAQRGVCWYSFNVCNPAGECG